MPTLASTEELLRRRSFEALAPQELAQLYRLMSELALAPPLRRTRRCGRPPRRPPRPARDAAREPANRRRSDPAAPAPPAQRRRRLVVLCDISGSMEAYSRAYLQFLTSATVAAATPRRSCSRRG